MATGQSQSVNLLVFHQLHCEGVLVQRRLCGQVIEQRLQTTPQGLILVGLKGIDEMLTEPDFCLNRNFCNGQIGGNTEDQIKDQGQQQHATDQPGQFSQRMGFRDVNVFVDMFRGELHGRFMTTAVP